MEQPSPEQQRCRVITRHNVPASVIRSPPNVHRMAIQIFGRRGPVRMFLHRGARARRPLAAADRVEFKQPGEEMASRPRSSLHGHTGSPAMPSPSTYEKTVSADSVAQMLLRRAGQERPRITSPSADADGSPVADRLCGTHLDHSSAWSARTRLAIRMPGLWSFSDAETAGG